MIKKIYLFAICLLIAVSIFTYKHVQDFSQTGFNWFNIPKTEELYILDYEKEVSDELDFSIYSSKMGDCAIDYCNQKKEVKVKDGINRVSLDSDSCSQENTINITCGDLKNRLKFKKVVTDLQDKIDFKELEINRLGGYLILNFSGVLALREGGAKRFEILFNNKTILKPIYLFSSGEKIGIWV